MVRHTRKQLIFEPPTIAIALGLRFDEHAERYGCAPDRIYLPSLYYQEFSLSVPEAAKLLMGGLYFRAALVLELEESSNDSPAGNGGGGTE